MSEAAAVQHPTADARAVELIREIVSLSLLAVLFGWSTWLTVTAAPPAWLDSLNFAGLCAGALVAIVLARGPAKLARTAAGRIALTGLTAAVAMSVYPAFHRMATGANSEALSAAGSSIPILILVFLWLAARSNVPPSTLKKPNTDERLETFLQARLPRMYMIALAALSLPALALASGWPLRAALWPAVFAGAMMLASKSVLHLAGTVRGAWVLSLCALVSSGVMAVEGFRAYGDLQNEAANAVASMEGVRADDEQRAYDHVLKMSAALRTNGPRKEMETAMARHYEQKNDLQNALKHWENVATLMGFAAPFDNFAPVQRVKCSMGDSLPAWRRLVYEGFKAIADPEIAPGIMRMGQTAPDVRAKLLAALLAWNANAPEAERRKWLDAVQKVSPGEPSSLNLLKRMDGPVKDVPMSLSPELLVGKIPYQSIEKTLEESGEVGTVVCLNTGHWELCLRAAGTPLHEEWPIVRVELNGTILATTQVNKAIEYDVPFTFDVTRNDIYKLKIVFQNHEEDLEEGRAARRGLRIAGIKFNHAKE